MVQLIAFLRLAATPNSEFLLELTLYSYRRAFEVDPWNPEVLLRTHNFVQSYPRVRDKLNEQEKPVRLLLRALALDPAYLPAYASVIRFYEQTGQPELAYALVREHLSPWLLRLTYLDDVRAKGV